MYTIMGTQNVATLPDRFLNACWFSFHIKFSTGATPPPSKNQPPFPLSKERSSSKQKIKTLAQIVPTFINDTNPKTCLYPKILSLWTMSCILAIYHLRESKFSSSSSSSSSIWCISAAVLLYKSKAKKKRCFSD